MVGSASTLPAMVDYRVVNPAEWIGRAMPLLQAHWAELSMGFELDPDAQTYQKLHEAGLMFAVAAVDADELVGYASVSVSPRSAVMCAPQPSASPRSRARLRM